MADFTPSPIQFCFKFPRRAVPSPIAGAPPNVADEGVICNSRCPLFIAQVDDKNRVVGGGCSIRFAALALVNFEQAQRAMMQMAAAPDAPSTPTN